MKLACRQVLLPLRLPLRVGGVTLDERLVLELRLTGADGRHGLGEAAPLPGLHAERLDQLPDLLPAARRLIAEGCGFLATISSLHDHAEWRALPPSLRCGLEGALLARSPLAALGTPPAGSELFDGGLTDVTTMAPDTRCLKVKVGRRDPATEVAVLRRLRERLGQGAEIRLDANRAYTLDEALAFTAAVRELHPVWIEEPLQDVTEMPEFLARSGLPVALDETLHEPGRTDLASLDGVAAWVLKPALLGVGGTLTAFTRATGSPNRPCCVVSSSFEGPRGLELLHTLARCAPGLPAPGLGTARWFGESEPEPWVVVHD